MIELNNITKSFQDTPALTQVTAEIQDGLIFGLVGSNGAGKSTLLRLISGILKPEEGEITLDGNPIYEHPEVKSQLCFLSDTVTYFPNATPESMGDYYRLAYPAFDRDYYRNLLQKFNISPKKSSRPFPKARKNRFLSCLASVPEPGICFATKHLTVWILSYARR